MKWEDVWNYFVYTQNMLREWKFLCTRSMFRLTPLSLRTLAISIHRGDSIVLLFWTSKDSINTQTFRPCYNSLCGFDALLLNKYRNESKFHFSFLNCYFYLFISHKTVFYFHIFLSSSFDGGWNEGPNQLEGRNRREKVIKSTHNMKIDGNISKSV